MKTKLAMVALSGVLFVHTAYTAEISKLPPNAVPLAEAEVVSLYRGKTETYQLIRNGEPRFEFKTYYGPDKKIIGYYDDYILPTRSDYSDGYWKVVGNKICRITNRHFIDNGIAKESRCNILFGVGPSIWIGTPAGDADGKPGFAKWTYDKFDGIRARLSEGNSAQQKYLELQKSVADGFKN